MLLFGHSRRQGVGARCRFVRCGGPGAGAHPMPTPVACSREEMWRKLAAGNTQQIKYLCAFALQSHLHTIRTYITYVPYPSIRGIYITSVSACSEQHTTLILQEPDELNAIHSAVTFCTTLLLAKLNVRIRNYLIDFTFEFTVVHSTTKKYFTLTSYCNVIIYLSKLLC